MKRILKLLWAIFVIPFAAWLMLMAMFFGMLRVADWVSRWSGLDRFLDDE